MNSTNRKYIINNNIISIIKTKCTRRKSIISITKMSIVYFRRNSCEKIYIEKPKKNYKKEK